jgi:nicotinamide phosphoribosyltransferase
VNTNPLYQIDFYKTGHASQYPPDTQQVWSNWTARSSRIPGETHVRWFGLRSFIQNDLMRWKSAFFEQPWGLIEEQYRAFMLATMGQQEPKLDHIKALHDLGHLPLDIWALPEGLEVPLGIPLLVLTNTHESAYWLPNYLETAMSNALWKATTSATTASRFRQLFTKHARKFGEKDLSFVDWQGHDFSYRGMSGLEDAQLSGMGHLLSFNGTDTIPAILAMQQFYDAPLGCGGSVPATEHSVMCAGGQEGELETFKRLITETYPTGIVSIVSDTWDLWRVLTDYIPRLKDEILKRDGKLVIRPDSGDPVKIICGDNQALIDSPAWYGALSLLELALGTDGHGHINKAGLIYGDGISLERADQILGTAVKRNLSPFNVVFGIGSWTYEYVTRDTYGFAMKATAVRRSGKILDIFKKPVTAEGGFSKASLKGIPAVYCAKSHESSKGQFIVVDGQSPEALDNCAFQKVFSNGQLLIREDYETIKQRVRNAL